MQHGSVVAIHSIGSVLGVACACMLAATLCEGIRTQSPPVPQHPIQSALLLTMHQRQPRLHITSHCQSPCVSLQHQRMVQRRQMATLHQDPHRCHHRGRCHRRCCRPGQPCHSACLAKTQTWHSCWCSVGACARGSRDPVRSEWPTMHAGECSRTNEDICAVRHPECRRTQERVHPPAQHRWSVSSTKLLCKHKRLSSHPAHSCYLGGVRHLACRSR